MDEPLSSSLTEHLPCDGCRLNLVGTHWTSPQSPLSEEGFLGRRTLFLFGSAGNTFSWMKGFDPTVAISRPMLRHSRAIPQKSGQPSTSLSCWIPFRVGGSITCQAGTIPMDRSCCEEVPRRAISMSHRTLSRGAEFPCRRSTFPFGSGTRSLSLGGMAGNFVAITGLTSNRCSSSRCPQAAYHNKVPKLSV